MPTTLARAACHVLGTADPAEKCRLTRDFSESWASCAIGAPGDAASDPPPDRPARPERPALVPPREMPRRRYGGEKGRFALLHALAHIELNAIDLAWDICVRFTAEKLPRQFYTDWLRVAFDEAEHFEMLERRMGALGGGYGDLPAHDGLWQAAEQTSDDLLARLALVPMTFEARGLDTTPPTIEKLRRNGDLDTVEVLDVIYNDEIRHVAAGAKWFKVICERRGLDPVATYHATMRARYRGHLKRPFNHAARAQAGLTPDYYEPLAEDDTA